MRKKYVGTGPAPTLLAICLLTMLTLIITACASSTTSANSTTPTSSSNDPNTVHLEQVTFEPNSITIKKGEKITLVSDPAYVHYIENGTWENDVQKPNIEPGAPKVEAQINGGESKTFGPFNTAGTFHLYCTLHNGMNLTVIVK